MKEEPLASQTCGNKAWKQVSQKQWNKIQKDNKLTLEPLVECFIISRIRKHKKPATYVNVLYTSKLKIQNSL